MPSYTEDEIRAKIADGSISAISVDTMIFDKYGCNLEFPILRKLDQFRGGEIQVLLSEIVSSEVERHIARDAAETQRVLKKAISSHGKRWKLDPAARVAPASFLLDREPDDAAKDQLADYLAAIGGEIVPALAQNDRTSEILRRYFATETPFEASEKKKSEFPDAFALVSLEAHGEREGTLILCVSADKGWRSFCEQSDHLVCLDDLDKALSYFNDAGRVIAENIIALLRAGVTQPLVDAVDSALEYRLDDNDFHADGWSSVEFETEPLSAVAQSIDWQSASPPVVIAADEDSVTFTTKLQVLVCFEANFQFSVRDSIDRDYVSLGSEEVYAEQTVEFELALTVARESKPEIEVIEADIARKHIEVDFGTVEPFQSENPYHEKY